MHFGKTRFAAFGVAAVLLMAAVAVLPSSSPSLSTIATAANNMILPSAAAAGASAADLARAMGLDPSEVASADLGATDPDGVAVMNSTVGGFPTEGTTFAVLSTGCAADVLQPNDEPNHSCVLNGLNTSQGEDLSQLKLVLNVPPNSTSLSFDWKFYSEEYPEFVGSPFNDAFLAETGVSNSTFTLSGANITAPNNVAFDQNGNLISINTSGFLAMSAPEANGTTYDGATPKLNTVAPVPAGATNFTLIFSTFDMGDSIFDTTVFIDNVKFATAGAPPPAPSTKKASDLQGVVPPTAAANSTINVAATLLDGTTAGPIANATIKWSMSPSGPSSVNSTTDAGGNTTAALNLAGLAPGNYTVKAVFEGDEQYQMSSFEKPLQITAQGGGPPPAQNRPPVAVNDTATTAVNSTKVIAVLANDSDPDGDPLTLESVTHPVNGTADKNVNGTVTYTPNFNFNGTDTFNYTISDGKGANATATVTVNVNGTAGQQPPPPPPPPPSPDEEKAMYCGRPLSDFANVKFGTNGNDVIWGTDKDDLIRGWGGNDTIYGMGGNDCLKGDNGNDVIWGGDGNDYLRGGDGNDQLHGDAGNDILNGHAGNDTLWGGDGNDTLLGETGSDRLIGDAGNDVMWGGDGEDKILGEQGNDTAYGDAGNDKIFGQAGNDKLWGGNDDDLIVGGDGNDQLIGDAGNDHMWGGDGNDTMLGGPGVDHLVGDAGNDTLQGENNDDVLLGEQGNDHMDGGAGTDKCYDVQGTNTVVNCEAAAMPATVSSLVAQLKNATSKYQDPAVAAADGYAPTDTCVPGMGYHYVNATLASDLNATELKPEVLVYEPAENGTRKLGAVEYFVPALANSPSGPVPWFGTETPPMGWNNTAPVLFEGQTFDGPMAGHEPGMPWHYDLHVWVWKDNPDGTFATLNPQVSCSS